MQGLYAVGVAGVALGIARAMLDAFPRRRLCDLDVLELDQSNGRLEVEFTLRHRHTWPRLREAQTQV